MGSHLCEFLLRKGDKVFCADNFITGRNENIKHLLKEKNFVFIKQDIRDPFHIKDEIKQIYNLASPASPVDFEKIPIQILGINSVGIKNMLDFAAEKNAVFLQASTSEVYGDALEYPQKETYWGNVNPIGPRSCYDEGKRFAESLVSTYRGMKKVDAKIARIFNTYGPRMRADDGRVIPNFITQCLGNRPITIYGNGEQIRSFCYVSEMVEGLYLLMNSNEAGPVNLGNPYAEISIIELAKKIKELTRSNSEISYKPMPENDPVRRKPDISKANSELGWDPKIDLESGLLKTIDYFKHLHG